MFRHPDEDDFYTGDPRRCPRHPHVATSTPDGLHDMDCGDCEAEAEADRAPSAAAPWSEPKTVKTSADLSVQFKTTDRYSESRRFKTLEGARAYAQKKIGETPEIGSFYAVGAYGDARITVGWTVGGRSARVLDLFPKCAWTEGGE